MIPPSAGCTAPVSLELLHPVRCDDYFHPLELLEIRVPGRGHGSLERADEVRGPVRHGGGPEEDLLERGDLSDPHAVAAGQLRVVRLLTPVPAAARDVGGAG